MKFVKWIVPSFFDVKKAELEEIVQTNIFESEKSGGILKLSNRFKENFFI